MCKSDNRWRYCTRKGRAWQPKSRCMREAIGAAWIFWLGSRYTGRHPNGRNDELNAMSETTRSLPPLGRLYLWATHRLYNELAWSYDLAAWIVSAGRWDRWRRMALDYVTQQPVLEVGFGTGELLLAMARTRLAGRGHRPLPGHAAPDGRQAAPSWPLRAPPAGPRPATALRRRKLRQRRRHLPGRVHRRPGQPGRVPPCAAARRPADRGRPVRLAGCGLAPKRGAG